MKKIVALLLGIAMLISCTSCSPKETEKESKNQETSDSETESVSESDPEESDTTNLTAPTRNPAYSTYDPADATSAMPSSNPYANHTEIPFQEQFVITEGTLTHLTFLQLYGDQAYGVYPKDSNGKYYGYVAYTYVSPDLLIIEDDSQPALQYALDYFSNAKADYAMYLFDDSTNALFSSLNNGEEPVTFSMYMKSTVVRADEQIVSFIYEHIPSGSYENASYLLETYNICPDCGESISLTDIITDMDTFTELLETYLATKLDQDTLSNLIYGCQDGSIPFVVAYDGILLHMGNSQATDDFVKIPAYLLEGMANMYWFGSTPEYYALYPEIDNYYVWDFYGDSALDFITFDCVMNDDDSLDHIDFNLNGNSVQIPADELLEKFEDLYWIGSFKSSFIMKTDKGYYLYLTFWGEDILEDTLIFHITEDYDIDQRFYAGAGTAIQEYPRDPANFYMLQRTEIGGTGILSATASVIRYSGRPRWTDDFLDRRSCVLVTRQDLKATNILGVETTIPAGTAISISTCIIVSQMVEIQVLSMSPGSTGYDNLFYVNIDAYADPPEFEGKPQEDVFFGVIYAG